MDAKTVALDILNWYCDDVKYNPESGMYRALSYDGEEEYKYFSEEELLKDWYATLKEDEDTNWLKEIEFIESYLGLD